MVSGSIAGSRRPSRLHAVVNTPSEISNMPMLASTKVEARQVKIDDNRNSSPMRNEPAETEPSPRKGCRAKLSSERHFVDPRETVFGNAEAARMMLDLDLSEARTRELAQCGNEAMHFAVERDILDQLRAVCLERAAAVAHGDTHDLGHDAVGHLGNEYACLAVLALAAPADRDVVAFLDQGQQHGNVGGIVLQVAVHGHDDLAAGVLDAGGHGGGLPVIAAEADDANAAVLFDELLGQKAGVVLAAIIHQYDLVALHLAFEGGGNGPVQRLDVFLLVVERDHDR